MKLNVKDLKKEIEAIGYYPTEELLYDTFNALCLFEKAETTPGQDIFAICLDGPPGAGKTSFAEAYVKLANRYFSNGGETVELIEYQCDPTTGKSELFEDINIGAAISHDESRVNIPGYLLKAIQKVSEGKKVVLFIDEYDKAREETDSFFLQLLQSGRINTTQHGDIEIPENFKTNLQVIFCRNDMREELSGPLTRRLRLLTLDYITPDLFYKIAYRNLIEKANNPVSEGMLNLVTLMYQAAYANREVYDRLAAASEMMIAITDANRLLTLADAPQHIIYRTLVKNMFKSKSDLLTFEKSIQKASTEDEKKLKSLLSEMKKNETPFESNVNELIASTVLKNEGKTLNNKIEELNRLIKEYRAKFIDMEESRKKAIQESIERIELEHGELVSTNRMPNVIKVFEDETAYIKRGMSVFSTTDGDLVDIACMNFQNLLHHNFYQYLIDHAPELNIQIFEDGIILENDNDIKLYFINDCDENGQIRYRFLSNYAIIPPKFIKTIEYIASIAKDIYKKQPKNASSIVNDATDISCATINIDALVYDEEGKISSYANEQVDNNLYHVEKVCFVHSKDEELKLIDDELISNPNLETIKNKANSLIKKKELTNE